MRSRLLVMGLVVLAGTSLIGATGCGGVDGGQLFPNEGATSVDHGTGDAGQDATQGGDQGAAHDASAGSDAGGGCAMTCASPPQNVCVDGTTLKTYSASGSCSAGACSYTSATTACTSGCAGGACIGDSCAGVTCDQPPAATCLDATTRRSFAAAGTCSNGTCSYTGTNTTCSKGCSNGACLPATVPDAGSCGQGAWTPCLNGNYTFSSCSTYCGSIGKCCTDTCKIPGGTGLAGAWIDAFSSLCSPSDNGSVASGACTDNWDLGGGWFECCCGG